MADTKIDSSQRQIMPDSNKQRIADRLEEIRVRHRITESSTPDLQQGIDVPAIMAALEKFRSSVKSIFAEYRQALQAADEIFVPQSTISEACQQLIRSTLKSKNQKTEAVSADELSVPQATVVVQIPQRIFIAKPKVDSPIPDSQNIRPENGFTQPQVIGKFRYRISPLVTRARFHVLPPRMVDDVLGLALSGCSSDTHLFDPGGTNCVKDCGSYQSWNFIEENLLSVEMVDRGLRTLAGGCSNLRKLIVANTSEFWLLNVAEACSRLQELELHKCADSVLLGIGTFENLQILRLLGNVDPLYNSLVSEIGLMILAQGCKRLVKLELVGCKGGFDGVKEIDQCCQMLEEFTVCDHRMESDWVGGLGYCANLKTLKLLSCKKIDHDSSGLSECLSGCCPALERLHLEKCQLRDKNAVKALFKMCEAAREIVFQDCWGLDNDIFSLATAFGRVKLLYLEGCSLLYFSRFEKPFKDQRNYQSEGRVMELLQKLKEAGLVKLMVTTSLREAELHELQETAEIDVAEMEKNFGNEQPVFTARLKKKNAGKDDELQSNITMVESPKVDENMGGNKEERKSCFRSYKGQKTTIAQPVNTEQVKETLKEYDFIQTDEFGNDNWKLMERISGKRPRDPGRVSKKNQCGVKIRFHGYRSGSMIIVLLASMDMWSATTNSVVVEFSFGGEVTENSLVWAEKKWFFTWKSTYSATNSAAIFRFIFSFAPRNKPGIEATPVDELFGRQQVHQNKEKSWIFTRGMTAIRLTKLQAEEVMPSQIALVNHFSIGVGICMQQSRTSPRTNRVWDPGEFYLKLQLQECFFDDLLK